MFCLQVLVDLVAARCLVPMAVAVPALCYDFVGCGRHLVGNRRVGSAVRPRRPGGLPVRHHRRGAVASDAPNGGSR